MYLMHLDENDMSVMRGICFAIMTKKIYIHTLKNAGLLQTKLKFLTQHFGLSIFDPNLGCSIIFRVCENQCVRKC